MERSLHSLLMAVDTSHRLITDPLAERAAASGNRVFCQAGDESLTYAQMWSEVRRVAGGLAALGVDRQAPYARVAAFRKPGRIDCAVAGREHRRGARREVREMRLAGIGTDQPRQPPVRQAKQPDLDA